jgi:hypothetical protein
MQPFFFVSLVCVFPPPSSHPCFAIKTGAAENEVIPYEVRLLFLPASPALRPSHIFLVSNPI